MEKEIESIFQILQKLTGLHRQLLETVRQEREALIQADLKGIQESTYSKEALIEGIRQQEALRIRQVTGLAVSWKRPMKELTLSAIAIAIQGRDPKGAEQLRSMLNVLTILTQRISEANADNQLLVEKSMEHIREMKKNVLGEAVPASQTYKPNGQRSSVAPGARLISKEA